VACGHFLLTVMDAGNVLGIRDFAGVHGCEDLKRAADFFARYNFVEVRKEKMCTLVFGSIGLLIVQVVDHDEFLFLPLKSLEELISSDVLNASAEEVFYPLMKWVNCKVEGRKQYLRIVSSR